MTEDQILSELADMRRLNQEARAMGLKPRDRRGMLLLLEAQDKRRERMQARFEEDLLGKVLWHYMAHCPDGDTWLLARELFTRLQARR